LETIREYALEHQLASGLAETYRQRHALYFVQLAETAETARDSTDQGNWLSKLAAEYANLRAAFAWSQEQPDRAVTGLRFVAALAWFWDRRGSYLTEGRGWIQHVLAHAPDVDNLQLFRAKALQTLAWMTWYQGDYTQAAHAAEAALALYRKLGNEQGVGYALLQLGRIARVQGNYAQAQAIEEQSLHVFQTIEDTSGMALTLLALGAVAREQGGVVQATEFFESSLRLYQQLDDLNSVAWTRYLLAVTARVAGDYARALGLCDESLALFRQLGSTRGSATVLLEAGRSLQAQGEMELARARYNESLQVRWKLAEIVPILECMLAIGSMTSASGSDAGILRAIRLFGSVDVLQNTFGFRMPVELIEEHEQQVRSVRAHVDETRFAKAWAEGRAMTLAQAVVYALDQTSSG
jgi:tetratricopeptide (TPR) repeat protein